jgi:hypothetical protein
MATAELVAVVNENVARAELSAGVLIGRNHHQFVVDEHAAGEILTRLRNIAELQIDKANRESAVDLALLAGPKRYHNAGGVLANMVEEAVADPLPQVELEPDLAHRFEALGQ